MLRRSCALVVAATLGFALAPGGAGSSAGRVDARTTRTQAPASLPTGWRQVARGAEGGAVFTGSIPNPYASDRRRSAVYLPPAYNPTRHYPVIYVLHGLPGSPASLYDGLRFAVVADGLIAAHRMPPFIAVIPVGGPIRNPEQGEWAGKWEEFVVRTVVPWADAHLSTRATMRSRAIVGVCAGGYGAINIGLRHPGLFGTLEAWDGYFAPVFHDGPLARASKEVLDANNPTLLVRREAPLLRRLGTRLYVSVGGNHAQIRRRWTLEYATLLTRLGLPHRLWLLPRSERGNFWRATMPSALIYAGSSFQQAG